MTPHRSATRLLPVLGCALAMAAALALSACGGGGAATAESVRATPPRQKAGVAASDREPCPGAVTTFADSLDRLRRQLAIGLSYEQYAARTKALTGAYDRLPIDRLGIDCLATTGTPAEKAFNKYIDAANAWGKCLADASCTTAAIEPVLQRKWRVASDSLPESQ
jgi:hypothetical protein